MDGTIIGQGSFVVPSTVVNQYIQIPSNADWMRVLNYTQTGTAGTASTYFGTNYYWQRGMPAGAAVVNFYATSTTTAVSADTIATGGFTLYDPSGQSVGALPLIGNPVAVSAVTNSTRPAVTHTADTTVSVGSIVRMSNTAQTDVNGVDMVVGTVTDSTHFTLLTATNALATAPGAIGGAGFYRVINNGNSALYYPRRRFVTNITQAANANVSTSVAHGLTPGQEVRFTIPDVSGMTQLNPQILNNYYPANSSVPAIVLSVVDDYNFTININTTAYAAFTWPTIAQQPSNFPEVTPFGEDSATSLSVLGAQVPTIGGIQIFNTNNGILADSTVNTGYLGMILGTGGLGTANTGLTITGPAGSVAGDVVYWLAGKSTYGGL